VALTTTSMLLKNRLAVFPSFVLPEPWQGTSTNIPILERKKFWKRFLIGAMNSLLSFSDT